MILSICPMLYESNEKFYVQEEQFYAKNNLMLY